MTKYQIIAKVLQGKKVYWKSRNYKVIRDNIGRYLIKCQSNGDVVGLKSEFSGVNKDTKNINFYFKD